jgi:hypothetical protein
MPQTDFTSQKKEFLSQVRKAKRDGKTQMFLVIVANTADPVIGAGCKLDIETVHSLFDMISTEMDFKLLELVIQGTDYSKDNVLDVLENMTPGADDIVIFYYTGHGFRFDNEQAIRTPQLDLRSAPATSKIDELHLPTKNLQEILAVIKTKGARLNIVIGDCCNADINFTRSFRNDDLQLDLMGKPTVNMNKKMAEDLFCFPKSSMLVASADEGQLSIVDEGVGSIFTIKFADNLKRILHSTEIEDTGLPWDALLKKTVDGTLKLSKTFDIGNGKPGNQKAFYIIDKTEFSIYG